MAEQTTAATIRIVPGGTPVGAVHHGLTAGLLRIELNDNQGSEDFPSGCLVEVDGEHMLYLGQVYSREGRTLVIGVEHAVDRRILGAIQHLWTPAE